MGAIAESTHFSAAVGLHPALETMSRDELAALQTVLAAQPDLVTIAEPRFTLRSKTLIVPLQFAVLFGMALSIVLQVFRQSNKVVVTQWVLQHEGFPIEQPPPRRLPIGASAARSTCRWPSRRRAPSG